MTACIYMSPPIDGPEAYDGVAMAVLLADTMATFEFPPPTSKTILPSIITAELNGFPSSVRLVRKLNIFHNFAWACAGKGRQIGFLAHEVRKQAEEWEQLERPMKRLGEISDTIGVQTVGAHVRDGVNNRLSPQPVQFVPHLGICRAIGSGGEQLMTSCINGAKFIENSVMADTHPLNKILGYHGSINGIRFAEEMMGEAKHSWGGVCRARL